MATTEDKLRRIYQLMGLIAPNDPPKIQGDPLPLLQGYTEGATGLFLKKEEKKDQVMDSLMRK